MDLFSLGQHGFPGGALLRLVYLGGRVGGAGDVRLRGLLLHALIGAGLLARLIVVRRYLTAAGTCFGPAVGTVIARPLVGIIVGASCRRSVRGTQVEFDVDAVDVPQLRE